MQLGLPCQAARPAGAESYLEPWRAV